MALQNTIPVSGSASRTTLVADSAAAVSSIAGRDESGDSSFKTLRAETGLRSAGHLFAGTADKTASFSADTTGFLYNISTAAGAVTASLPAAASYSGAIFAFKKTTSDTNTVTIEGDGSETIDGSTSFVLRYRHECVLLQCDGSNWKVIGQKLAQHIAIACLLNEDVVDQAFYTAPRAMQVVGVTEIHATLGTDAGAVNLQLTKDTGTAAPGAGTNLLTNNTSAGFDLKGTINTLQTGTLSATEADLQMAAGDRLAVDPAGVVTAVAGVVVTVAVIEI